MAIGRQARWAPRPLWLWCQRPIHSRGIRRKRPVQVRTCERSRGGGARIEGEILEAVQPECRLLRP